MPQPTVGRIVHYVPMRMEWTSEGPPPCVAALVLAIQGCASDVSGETCVSLSAFMPDGTTRFVKHATPHEMPERGSWHWPCTKAEPAAEPEPDEPPTTITINVHGVLTERQLGDAIEKHLLRAGMRSPTAYSSYRR